MQLLRRILIALSLCLIGVPPLHANPPKIGITYFSTSAMAERVLSGFTAELGRMHTPMDLEYRVELADLNALESAIREFEKTKDAIIIMRSTGAKWLATHKTKVPTFVAACNHPGQLGIIRNLEEPEGNVTGVTYYLPRATQWEIFLTLLPSISSIYLLLEKGHPSSDVDLAETIASCKRHGIKMTYRYFESLEPVYETIAQHRNKVSAFVLGTQALYIDHARQIVGRFPNTIFLSYNSKPVEDGALGGFVADDELLGRKLAQSVRDVLIERKPISRVPVKFDENPKFVINVKTAEQLQIAIPFEILQAATLVGEKK